MKVLWTKIKSSALLTSGLITGLCLAIYWLGPISVWETNDDVYYNLLFAGKLLTSSPDAHVIMINYVLSSFFVTLYTLVPALPWYAFFQVATILAAIFILNYYYGLARNNDKFFLRMVISLGCALPFLFYLQFTKTSLVLGITGYLGLYLLNEVLFTSRRQSILLHALAAAFLLLSYSLRKESFYLATLLCGLLVVRALLQRKRALILSLVVTGFFVMLFAGVHRQHYGSEWQGGSKAIEQMINYNQFIYEDNQKVYDAAGLSRNDYEFLMDWGFIDDKVYSVERLDYILNHARKTPVNITIFSGLKDAVSFPAEHYLLTLAILATLLLLVYRQKYTLLCGTVLLPFLLCVGILLWQGRFPPRVSTAMAFSLPWAILLWSGELRNRLYSIVISVVALVAVALPVYGEYKDLTAVAQFRLFQNQALHQLGAVVARKPMVLATLGGSFPYEGMLPFESFDYLSGANLVWFCGMNQTPVQKKQLADNRIKDIFATMMTDDSTYIVMQSLETEILKKYISEHYRKSVYFFPVYSGEIFIMYRLRLIAATD